MLIVSKWSDYYDSITAYGIDKTVVYKREQSSLPLKDERHGFPLHGDFRNSTVFTCAFVIGFCGKFYPLLKITKTTKSKIYPYNATTKTFLAYSAEGALEKLRELKVRLGVGKYTGFGWWSMHHEAQVREFFDLARHDRDYGDYFMRAKAPVFIVGRNLKNWKGEDVEKGKLAVLFNPQLKPWHFMALKPPPVAHQEIYMFISGVLGVGERPTIEVADKYKAIAHGHDGRYSFRTPPKVKK